LIPLAAGNFLYIGAAEYRSGRSRARGKQTPELRASMLNLGSFLFGAELMYIAAVLGDRCPNGSFELGRG
jgi:hypothetical protein